MLSKAPVLSALSAFVLGIALAGCAAADETDPAGAAPEPGQPLTSPPATPSTDPSESASSDSDATGPTPELSKEAAPEGPTLAVKIAGEKSLPNAEDIQVKVGEPLLLTFDSDRAGELHVHSKPDQYVQFEAGTSQQMLVITTPGLVEIEDHDTEDVFAIVEVR